MPKLSATTDGCVSCGQGTMRTTPQDIEFRQWTNRGYIVCRATIPIAVCDRCGAKEWSEEAEAIVDAAARQAIEDNR